MKRRILAVLAAVALVGGCGLPDNTTVVRVGPGPSRNTTTGGDIAPSRPTRLDATVDYKQFVANYLAAAAGDFDSAANQVKEFMSPELKASFKASADIKVLRIDGTPVVNPGQPEVTVYARTVGTLSNFGIFTPSPDDMVTPYELAVGTVPGEPGLFITKAPSNLLLSTTALSSFYATRTIYFWNINNTGLIPDVRYMPLSVPPEQQPNEVLNWLINGPAQWLSGIAEPLPSGTKLLDNVPAISGDKLQVSLSSQALPATDAGPALDRLQKQLRWSLRPNVAAALELSIEHQPEHEFRGTDYLASNAAYRATGEPERFVLYDGVVHRLAKSYNATGPIPVLEPAANKNVQAAAFSGVGQNRYAALIVNDGNGKQSLRVGAAATGQQAPLHVVGGLPATIGAARPVWAPTPPDSPDDTTIGLVLAKGQPYSFTPGGAKASRVSWPGGLADVSAIAVAPDSLRVALVSRGRLYLSTLSNDNGVQLSEPIRINTVMSDLTAVDWSAEGTLVVAGSNVTTHRVALMDVSVDGASQTDRLADLGINAVTFLAAYPANPSRGQDAGVPVAYVLNNAAYDESNSERIDVGDLLPAVAGPKAGMQPTSPFFLD
jgi:hypothetical protein